jgi:hypothetical protein
MIIFPSNKVADLVNVTLANTWGTTTTADGATSDGLICNEDLSNIVQCGAEINNALTKSPSMFYNAVTKMLETVSDIYYETISSDYADLNRYGLEVSSGEFACLKEKVRIDSQPFEAAFVLDGEGNSTFDDLFAKHPFTFDVKVWGNKGFYRTKPFTISYEMLKTSVQSRNGWDRLIAEMWGVIDAVMDLALAESPYFLIKQQIANAALYRNGIRVVNLAAEYKTATGNNFVAEDDPPFSKWFVKYQRHLNKLMNRVTNKFSGKATLKMNTPESFKCKWLIDTFYDDINAGLSGVYHDNKIGNIDDYELEPFIQNVNEPYKLEVTPANAPILTLGSHVTKVTFSKIVGMIWDKRGTFWNSEYRKVANNPNTFDDHVNYVSTAGAQHCVDEDSNVVVFVIDTTEGGKGYVITEEQDTTEGE